MKLTDSEQAMLEGRQGKAQQKAMELLVRYAEALGAQRFVDTTNVAGVPGSSNPYLQNYYSKSGNTYDAIFSHFDLDSDELVEVPRVTVQVATSKADSTPTTGSGSAAMPKHSRSARSASTMPSIAASRS